MAISKVIYFSGQIVLVTFQLNLFDMIVVVILKLSFKAKHLTWDPLWCLDT